MEQLLQIHTTRGQISQQTTRGQFVRTGKYGDNKPEVKLHTSDGGGLKMSKRPMSIEINMDEVLRSVNPSVAENTLSNVQAGREAALAYTAKLAQEGRAYMNPDVNGVTQSSRNIVLEHANDNWGLGWTPSVQCETEITPDEISFSYQRDEVSLELKRGQSEFDFRPGSASTDLAVAGKVDIKYVGSFRRFPTGQHIDTKA